MQLRAPAKQFNEATSKVLWNTGRSGGRQNQWRMHGSLWRKASSCVPSGVHATLSIVVAVHIIDASFLFASSASAGRRGNVSLTWSKQA